MARQTAAWAGLGLLLCIGCAENASLRRALATPYQPANVHRLADTLPARVQRVALLPLTAGPGHTTRSGVQTLEPILGAELRKRGLFEVVPVSAAQLQAWTGSESWRVDETLPADLFSRVRQQTACDAVLFCDLSTYHPYPPLAVGWHLSLVDGETQAALWTVDEVFDAGSPGVIAAAQNYYRSELNQPSVQLDSAAVLNSPRRFGQYSAAAALGTLPGRAAAAKATPNPADK
jgi:hypothetical protein